MPHANSQKPVNFWTWQDAQIDDERRIRESIADIAARAFGTDEAEAMRGKR